MWIFTTIGFFSAVQKHGTAFVTLRGRSAADLDRLREQFMPELSPTKVGGGSDYPVRATISHKAFASGMAKVSAAVDYHNFKSEVVETMGWRRERIYAEVWKTLRKIEEESDQSEGVA